MTTAPAKTHREPLDGNSPFSVEPPSPPASTSRTALFQMSTIRERGQKGKGVIRRHRPVVVGLYLVNHCHDSRWMDGPIHRRSLGHPFLLGTTDREHGVAVRPRGESIDEMIERGAETMNCVPDSDPPLQLGPLDHFFHSEQILRALRIRLSIETGDGNLTMNERQTTRGRARRLGERGWRDDTRAEAEDAQGLRDPSTDAGIDLRGVQEDRPARQEEALDRPFGGGFDQVAEHRVPVLTTVVAPRPLVQVALQLQRKDTSS
jgi:hypothetical protein